jgi:hypothetical protein
MSGSAPSVAYHLLLSSGTFDARPIAPPTV